MSQLRKNLIRLAYQNPELRKDLLPLLGKPKQARRSLLKKRPVSADYMMIYGAARAILGKDKAKILATLWTSAGGPGEIKDLLDGAKDLSWRDFESVYPHVAAALAQR
jgi:hypothetical protein